MIQVSASWWRHTQSADRGGALAWGRGFWFYVFFLIQFWRFYLLTDCFFSLILPLLYSDISSKRFPPETVHSQPLCSIPGQLASIRPCSVVLGSLLPTGISSFLFHFPAIVRLCQQESRKRWEVKAKRFPLKASPPISAESSSSR